MQALTLTKEQQDKLLEMAKHYFGSQYKGIFMSDQKGSFIFESWGLDYILFTDDMGGFAGKIPWFEFVMSHLSEKVLEKDETKYYELNVNIYEDFSGSWKLKGHPIDYLYDKFKK